MTIKELYCLDFGCPIYPQKINKEKNSLVWFNHRERYFLRPHFPYNNQVLLGARASDLRKCPQAVLSLLSSFLSIPHLIVRKLRAD